MPKSQRQRGPCLWSLFHSVFKCTTALFFSLLPGSFFFNLLLNMPCASFITPSLLYPFRLSDFSTKLTKRKVDPNTDVMSSSYLKIKTLVGRGEEEEEDVERGSGVKVKVKFVGSQLKNRLNVGEGVSERKGGGAVVQPPPCCLVESCRETLTGCKKYYQRHRVCEVHGKAPVVLVDGLRQRFCQQCSRFHELSEFDKTKRSCRRRLAGHNERRRKSSLESQKNGTVRSDLNNEHTEVRSDCNKAFDTCCKSL